ncbi:MAG TPA: hypothetical protein VFZ79_08765 [Acidimicrobiales bacterium]
MIRDDVLDAPDWTEKLERYANLQETSDSQAVAVFLEPEALDGRQPARSELVGWPSSPDGATEAPGEARQPGSPAARRVE